MSKWKIANQSLKIKKETTNITNNVNNFKFPVVKGKDNFTF